MLAWNLTTNKCARIIIEAALRNIIDDDIHYGDVGAIAGLIQNIADRKGIGDLLARGIKATATAWNLEEFAIHVKGMEPAGYDPRVLKGMGLTYGTSPRGACHLRTTFYKPELSGIISPETIENKAQLLIDYEDRLNIFDTSILCRFYRDLYTWKDLEKLIYWVTDIPMGKDKLQKSAANIATMTKIFNIREGLEGKDERLPSIFHTEALPSGHILVRSKSGSAHRWGLQKLYQKPGQQYLLFPASSWSG